MPMVNIIVGLPGETASDAQQTIEFVKKLQVPVYSHNLLRVYRGTRLHRSMDHYGLSILEGPTGLPYITKHAYDVSQIAPLGHAIISRELREAREALGDILAGRTPRENSTANMVFVWYNTDERIDMSFLRQTLGLNTAVIFYRDGISFDMHEIESIQIRCVEAGVPSSDFRFLHMTDGMLHYTFYNEYWQTIRLPVTPLASYNRAKEAIADKWNVLLPGGQADLTTLKKILTDADREQYEGTNPFADPYCVVSESCRYGLGQCALDRDQQFIARNRLLPCLSACREIEIKSRIQRDEELRKRGCNKCEIADQCPKCLYLQDIRTGEYCRFMKSNIHRLQNLDNNNALLNAFRLYTARTGILTEDAVDEMKQHILSIFDPEDKSLHNLEIATIWKKIDNGVIDAAQRKSIINALLTFTKFRKGINSG